MALKQIRNFSIIAHIDHGKSTLADRLIEVTGTIEKRKMREQVLDMMDLERERGITIKMQPVRMRYRAPNGSEPEYILNLIDTPGHVDFAYEVSRALKAVEGVVLLIDATQGVQAQTVSVLTMARELGLTVIPVVNKIDLALARVAEVKEEIVDLLGGDPAAIIAVSGKTGEGVPQLLAEIIKRVPPPHSAEASPGEPRALVFDFEYSTHQGLIVYVRVFDGEIKAGDELLFAAAGEKFVVQSVGQFQPEKTPVAALETGAIGYLVTGVKKITQAKVGETIVSVINPRPPFLGYSEPKPVVWVSVYPTSQDDFARLKQSLGRLKLSDAALTFEEEGSLALGRGFRCGFLGLLHLEIAIERLRREFNLNLIVATPTIGYEVLDERSSHRDYICSPPLFPEDLKGKKVLEPWVAAKIITPTQFLSAVMKLFNDHEVLLLASDNFSRGRLALEIELPLRELMRNFFDELKSVSSGFASFSYRLLGHRPAEVVRLDILVNGEVVPAFSRVVARAKVEREAEVAAARLETLLPRQLIVIKIQARALGRILASRTISALRKDVTGYLYGGDITRKMKLREKQKKGKKKMQARGTVQIPPAIFLKMISQER